MHIVDGAHLWFWWQYPQHTMLISLLFVHDFTRNLGHLIVARCQLVVRPVAHLEGVVVHAIPESRQMLPLSLSLLSRTMWRRLCFIAESLKLKTWKAFLLVRCQTDLDLLRQLFGFWISNLNDHLLWHCLAFELHEQTLFDLPLLCHDIKNVFGQNGCCLDLLFFLVMVRCLYFGPSSSFLFLSFLLFVHLFISVGWAKTRLYVSM